MNTSNLFSSEVRTLLEQGGWYEGREGAGTYEVPSDVVYPEGIEKILNEFGGLYIKSNGPGISLVRNSIEFDPSDAEGESSEDGILTDYSSKIGRVLYPIGHVPKESLMLCTDLDGNVYMVGDYLYMVGHSFAEGISNILLGIKGKQFKESDSTWMD